MKAGQHYPVKEVNGVKRGPNAWYPEPTAGTKAEPKGSEPKAISRNQRG